MFSCENTVIPTRNELELLAVTVDSELKMKSRDMQESEPANCRLKKNEEDESV